MREVLLLSAALLVMFAGLAWFALAKEPHWRQLRGAQPLPKSRVRLLQVLGTLALIASGTLCLMVDHVSMAFLVWVMALASAGLAVTFTLSWRPSWLGSLIAWIPRSGATT